MKGFVRRVRVYVCVGTVGCLHRPLVGARIDCVTACEHRTNTICARIGAPHTRTLSHNTWGGMRAAKCDVVVNYDGQLNSTWCEHRAANCSQDRRCVSGELVIIC